MTCAATARSYTRRHPARQPGERAAASDGPTPIGNWLTASVVDDAASVVARVFDEAARRVPDHRRTWVALVDGNNHQIDRIHAETHTHDVTVHVLRDFVHVIEYLWKATWCFHREGDPAAEAWVHDKARSVLAGRVTPRDDVRVIACVRSDRSIHRRSVRPSHMPNPERPPPRAAGVRQAPGRRLSMSLGVSIIKRFSRHPVPAPLPRAGRRARPHVRAGGCGPGIQPDSRLGFSVRRWIGKTELWAQR
jgi:hypothetical protein